MDTFSAEKKNIEISTMKSLIDHHTKIEPQMTANIKEDEKTTKQLKRILPGEKEFWEDIDYQEKRARKATEKELLEMQRKHAEKVKHLQKIKNDKS